MAMYILEYETYRKSLSNQGFSEEVSKIVLASKSGAENAAQFVTARLVEALCLSGNSDAVKKQIKQFEERGVDLLILEPCFFPNEEFEDTVRRTIKLSGVHNASV